MRGGEKRKKREEEKKAEWKCCFRGSAESGSLFDILGLRGGQCSAVGKGPEEGRRSLTKGTKNESVGGFFGQLT